MCTTIGTLQFLAQTNIQIDIYINVTFGRSKHESTPKGHVVQCSAKNCAELDERLYRPIKANEPIRQGSYIWRFGGSIHLFSCFNTTLAIAWRHAKEAISAPTISNVL